MTSDLQDGDVIKIVVISVSKIAIYSNFLDCYI